MDFGSIARAFGSGLVDVALPSLGTILAAQGVRVLTQVAKKKGIEITEAQQDQLRQVVVDAVHRAEETGRRENLSGAQKRVIASDVVINEARALVVDGEGITRERAGKMIDAVLPAIRGFHKPSAVAAVVLPPASSV